MIGVLATALFRTGSTSACQRELAAALGTQKSRMSPFSALNMPRLEDITYERIVVDGQPMVIPHDDAWDRIFNEKELDGFPLAAPNIVKDAMLKDVRQYNDMTLALGIGLPKTWVGYVLLKTPDGWQRVQLVQIQCQQCNWEGLAATAWLVDIYAGVADWQSCMEKAQLRFPILSCPNCGGRLPTAPIWLAPGQ